MAKVFCDGSQTKTCVVIEGQEPIITSIPKTTGNAAEYYGIIHALQEAKRQGLEDLVIYSDSQLAVRQLTYRDGRPVYLTKKRHLQELRNLVRMLMKGFKSVEFRWIPRSQSEAGLVLDGKL